MGLGSRGPAQAVRASLLQTVCVAFVIGAAGCGGMGGSAKGVNHVAAPDPSLSAAELAYVRGLAAKASASGEAAPLVRLNVVSFEDGALTQVSVPTASAEEQASRLERQGVVTLDLPVTLTAGERADAPDEQLLFNGMAALGLTEWASAYPEADGRGVTIAVVDDGVALGRPGLRTTSTGARKIARHLNASPLWWLPLREGFPEACAGALPGAVTSPVAQKAADARASWRVEAPLPGAETITKQIDFVVTSCGVNPELTRRPRTCLKWAALIPKASERTVDGVTWLPARYIESGEGTVILVDVDGDGVITSEEALSPLSAPEPAAGALARPRFHSLADGHAIAFDLADGAALLGPVAPEVDHPLHPCMVGAPVTEKTLIFMPPHTADEFGTHGEGVASVAAGHRIAGRPFDGAAPGAQVVDVHFGDTPGGRRYTMAEVGRALRMGAQQADIVNLSYSLFFNSAAAEAALGRFLESYLSPTTSLFFFSAGNNGPGRGSMNRGLVYPSFGLAVGAYLAPELSQTVFGSAVPVGGVVTYSSRGPGPDGASGPFVISPLASMADSTPTTGLQRFSGTSSATPALAGAAARLLSRIKAEGLPFQRLALKEALARGARPLEGVPFIDQGFGLPQLTAALAHYRALVASTAAPRPPLTVTGARGASGIVQRGIFVRGDRDRLAQYAFTLAPHFAEGAAPAARLDYAESLRLTVEGPAAEWVMAPPRALIGPAGAAVNIAINWEHLSRLGGGEHLATVRVENIDDGALRAVIPVTLLQPHRHLFHDAGMQHPIEVRAGELTRLLLEPPPWARGLLLSVEAVGDGQELCGQFKWYDPSAVRVAGRSFAAGSLRSDAYFAVGAAGLHELIFEGRGNHVACPAHQQLRVRGSWVSVRAATAQTTLDPQNRVAAHIAVTAEGRALSGVVRFTALAQASAVPLSSEGAAAYEWRTAAPFGGAGFAAVRFALDGADLQERAAPYGYGYYTLSLLTGNDARMAQLIEVPASGAPSEAVPTEGDEFAALHAALTQFDFGLTADGLPGATPRLWAYFTRGGAGAFTAPAPQRVTLRPGSAAWVHVSLPELGPITAPALQCELLVDGFEAAVPCGWVRVR